MSKKLLALMLLLVFASGCARQTLLLSQPAGAQVEINGEKIGITPCTYKYSMSSEELHYAVVLSKPGFQTLATDVAADERDAKARNRWLAAGLVWSPLWLGTLFTKRLKDEYLFVLDEAPDNLARNVP